jgi:hypothetical protein
MWIDKGVDLTDSHNAVRTACDWLINPCEETEKRVRCAVDIAGLKWVNIIMTDDRIKLGYGARAARVAADCITVSNSVDVVNYAADAVGSSLSSIDDIAETNWQVARLKELIDAADVG